MAERLQHAQLFKEDVVQFAEEDLAAALTPRALIDLVNRMTAAA